MRRDEAIIRMCSRATEIDPGYARAWALMALGQMAMRFDHGGRGDGDLEAAERALALDGNLAEAHAVKASYFGENTQHAEALQEIEIPLGRSPAPAGAKAGARTGSRTIDLDILLYDDLVFQNDTLVVGLIEFDATTVRTASAHVIDPGHSFDAAQALANQLMDPTLKGVLVLSDGLGVNGSELICGLNSVLPP